VSVVATKAISKHKKIKNYKLQFIKTKKKLKNANANAKHVT